MSIQVNHLKHIYSYNTPFSFAALNGVNLTISTGKVTAIIGATGSGKSTLVQHLNGLLLPTHGSLELYDYKIESGKSIKGLKNLRKQVGLVFQFPEYQLFEETILKDVAFGPKNFGDSEEEAQKKAKLACEMVGLDGKFLERSPLDLSGGQKRRVAIAGILAMQPQALVLDEPTAGLDPQGAKQMMSLFVRYNQELKKTVLIVTHDMEHVMNYCDEVIVMKDGAVYSHTSKNEFFKDTSLLKQLRIVPPSVVSARELLNKKGFTIKNTVMNIDDLVEAIAKEVKHG